MQIDEAREFIKFLHGAVPWNGTWFGEYAPGEKGAHWWRKHLDEAIAALIAAPAAPQQAEPVSDEWVTVPREPTDEMVIRGAESLHDNGIRFETDDSEPEHDLAADTYRAMLNAAPAAPQEHTGRWNIDVDDSDGSLLICKGEHEKSEACVCERYVPESKAPLSMDGKPVAPQQAEPVAWMAFGGALVHAVTRNAMDPIEAERFDVPLYLHPPAAPQQAEPVAWRDHVEQRLHNWRQRTMNRSGDRLALDDMMSKESIDDLIDYVCDEWSDPVAPQQAEPVAQIGWADEFGNLFPMGAWKPTQRTHHDSHKAAWRPVFLHPPADEVRLQGGLDNEELLEAWRTKVPGVEPTDSDLRAFALGVEFGTRGKRVYFDERNSARDAWRRRVKQCETLEAEVQRLRDALEQIEREANQPYIQRIAAAALKVGE